MISKLKAHHVSFKYALAGIFWAVKTQPNFKIHFVLSSLAVLLGIILEISRWEWIIIIITLFWGISSEMLNTALESMTDLITTEWRQEAKIAKDVAAGMMLIVALGTVVVAAIIFIPKIITLFI